MKDMNRRIYELTKIDLKHKTTDQLFLSLLEEIGELATEIKIENKVFGNSYKIKKEGIVGESVDVYICCMAMFFAENSLNEKETIQRLSLLKMKDTYDFYNWPIHYYMRQMLKHINGPFIYYIEAAQCAINIFFKNNNKEEDFYGIGHFKLDKWEKNQQESS